MTFDKKDLELAYKDGYAASKAGKLRERCQFVIVELRVEWNKGWVQYRADRKEEIRIARQKYVQRFNPAINKWERYSKGLGVVVGSRKKKYCVAEGNW